MKEKIAELLEKARAYFSKEGLPFKIEVDEQKAKVDALIAFCKDKTTKTIEKFEELMLVDGTTKVVIEPAVEPGAAMAIYDAEGNPIPAPAGANGPAEYELSDGRIVVVEQDGVVAMVKDKAEELDAEGNQKKPADNTSAAPGVKEMIERIETVSRYNKELSEKFEAYKKETDEKIAHLNKENDTLKTDLHEFKKFNKKAMETLLSEPATPPVTPVVNPFGKQNSKGNIFEMNFKQ